MEARSLPPTTDSILEACPRFRILLVGKSGVGKSSLINYAFNVDLASVSHNEHGVCDITKEIMSPQNPRFVLHDSQGFEPSEISNLEKVISFIESRGAGVDVRERVHAVWLCVQIPFAGGRVFETGDEKFLKFVAKADVPVVVVFTQFDKLVSLMEENLTDEEVEMSDDDITKLCLQRADAEFQTACVKTLQKISPQVHMPYVKTSVNDTYRSTMAKLIEDTQVLVGHHVEGDVWIVSAMAQRASAQAKIRSSIEVGMKQYWHSLATSTSLVGWNLEQCLAVLHRDITSSWNFHDPQDLLNSKEFQTKIMILVQWVALDRPEHGPAWQDNVDGIQNTMTVASSLASIAGPVIAAIGLSVMFFKFIKEIYKKNPEVLRCLMVYIVDLTLIMDQLFLNTLPLKPPRILSQEQIDGAVEDYKNSEQTKVHQKIREYANRATFIKILKANDAQEEVKRLIEKHRSRDV